MKINVETLVVRINGKVVFAEVISGKNPTIEGYIDSEELELTDDQINEFLENGWEKYSSPRIYLNTNVYKGLFNTETISVDIEEFEHEILDKGDVQ